MTECHKRIAIAMFCFAVVGSPAVAQPAASDADLSRMSIEHFREKPELATAIDVCRLALGQSLRGISITSDAIREYEGRGQEILSLTCNGYLQGATDVLNLTPEAAPTAVQN